MTDLEKVNRMKEANWTPAATYWYTKYTKAADTIKILNDKIASLEGR